MNSRYAYAAFGIGVVSVTALALAWLMNSESPQDSDEPATVYTVLEVEQSLEQEDVQEAAFRCIRRLYESEDLGPWFDSQEIEDVSTGSSYEFRMWADNWSGNETQLALEACMTLDDAHKMIIGTNSRLLNPAQEQFDELLYEELIAVDTPRNLGDLTSYGLEDREVVWCADNMPTVITAADRLGIGPDDSIELATDLYITTDVFWAGPLADGPAADYLDQGDRRALWWNRHFDNVARACGAAFGAR